MSLNSWISRLPTPPSSASLRRELTIFSLFVLLSIALTWPLAARLGTAVSDLGDPLLVAWILDWDCHALLHGPLQIFDAPVFSPAAMPLAYSENLIGIALFALPFHAAGLTPITVYNLMMLLGFAMSGYGAYVLVRMIVRSTPAAVTAGIFFAFTSYRFDHLAHLQIIWAGWLPLLLAALLSYWRRPSFGSAALLAGAFFMNGLTNVHWLLFGSVSTFLTAAFLALAGGRRTGKFWLTLAGALLLGGTLLLPVLLPYRAVSRIYGLHRERGEAMGGSANWSDWLMAGGRSVFYGNRVSDPDRRNAERQLFPGLMPLFLAAAAILATPRRKQSPPMDLPAWTPPPPLLLLLDTLMFLTAIGCYLGAASRRWQWGLSHHTIIALDSADVPFVLFVATALIRLALAFPQGFGGGTLRSRLAESRFSIEAWAAAVWGIVGFAGTFGLHFAFHQFLYRRVTIFQSIRVPARWAIIVYAGLAVWAGLGAAALMAGRQRRWTVIVAGVIAALMIADVLPVIRWDYGAPAPTEFYRWLNASRGAPGGSVLEMPVSEESSYLYMLGATNHHVPIMNGISGFEPPPLSLLHDAASKRRYDEAFLNVLEKNGCALLVVHQDLMAADGPPAQAWIARQLSTGRLAFVRRFDNAVYGDWLFAVTRNAPRWQSLAADGNREGLDRFLRGDPTYNHAAFGRMDRPEAGETVDKRLEVTGWALSPLGIRKVDVLIEGGRIRVPAVLTPRSDISQTWPWYPQSAAPAFTAVVPKRPKGIPRETDVQVEIVDGNGRRMRLRDAPVTWQ